jgi:hypothetical protein
MKPDEKKSLATFDLNARTQTHRLPRTKKVNLQNASKTIDTYNTVVIILNL